MDDSLKRRPFFPLAVADPDDKFVFAHDCHVVNRAFSGWASEVRAFLSAGASPVFWSPLEPRAAPLLVPGAPAAYSFPCPSSSINTPKKEMPGPLAFLLSSTSNGPGGLR